MSEKEKEDEGGDFVEGNVVEHNVGSWWQDLSVKNKIFMIVGVLILLAILLRVCKLVWNAGAGTAGVWEGIGETTPILTSRKRPLRAVSTDGYRREADARGVNLLGATPERSQSADGVSRVFNRFRQPRTSTELTGTVANFLRPLGQYSS